MTSPSDPHPDATPDGDANAPDGTNSTKGTNKPSMAAATIAAAEPSNAGQRERLEAALKAQGRFFDPLADEPSEEVRPSGSSLRGERTDGRTTAQQEPKVLVEFKSPSQFKEAILPEGLKLVGDYHVTRGSPFVMGGAPGVGKSRAAVALAVAGATGQPWFGLQVHRKFKTMILQAENGTVRLKNEFSDLDCAALEGWVCVSPPPPNGFAFMDRYFKAQLKAQIAAFKPDVFIIDPWNQCVQDATEKDYMLGFENVRSCLPVADEAPAFGIVAHTRKPRMGEKATGRGLMNLLSGSYVLASVPRSVFVIQPASDDTTDKRIVFACCKNNDGELGDRSAWERRNGLFAGVKDFNWEEFDGGAVKKEGVTEADVLDVFDNGPTRMKTRQAVDKLMELAGVKRTAAYEALKLHGGKFSQLLMAYPDHTIGLANPGSGEE